MFFASNCANIVRNFINMNVIDNIFKIMAQKGIKQRTLADAMGIDESQISVMKKGNRDLKISEIENIASCLGISLGQSGMCRSNLLEKRF